MTRALLSHNRRRAGYSLMEMSIVLTVLAVIATSVLGVAQDNDRDKKIKQTQATIVQIERALANYYHVHHRLPCPASGSTADSNVAYGIEAKREGNCTDGANPATSQTAPSKGSEPGGTVVTGVLPVRTLEIPDALMYDAWNRRITYTVDQAATGLNALLENDANTSTLGNIRVNDGSGNLRSNAAVYTLLSHGSNGDGGFLASGTRMSAGSTNVDELENSDGDGILVMKNETLDPTSSATRLNAFDDIMVFKERWALMTGADRVEMRTPNSSCGPDGPGYTGPNLLVAMNTDANGRVIRGYTAFANNNFTEYTATIFAPGAAPDSALQVTSIKLSKDNKLLFLGFNAAPYFATYYWTSFLGFQKMADPVAMPSNAPQDADWSHDDSYIAIGFSNGLRIYKFDESNCALTYQDPASNKGPDTVTVGDVASVAWHPTLNFLAIGGTGHRLALYKEDTTTPDQFDYTFGTYVDTICSYNGAGWISGTVVPACVSGRHPGTTAAGDNVKQVDWSPDGARLLVSSGSTRATHLVYNFTPNVTSFDASNHYLTEAARFSVAVPQNGGLAAGFTNGDTTSGTFLFTSNATNTAMYKIDAGAAPYALRFHGTIPGNYSNAGNCGIANLTDFDISSDNYIAFASTSLNQLVVAQITNTNTGDYNCLIQDDGYTPSNSFKVEFAH